MSRRICLLIGSSVYKSPSLSELKTPIKNIEDLGDVLREPSIGAFHEVIQLRNPQLIDAQKAIGKIFSNASRDDLVLLYFSGHGLKDDRGNLYFATSETETEWPDLVSTAISGTFIRNMIRETRSRRVVVILDCCFAGAFAGIGALGAGTEKIEIESAFEGSGSGKVILTSTDRTTHAWESDLDLPEIKNSIFTHFIIQGLRHGSADRNSDGLISTDELFDYARENVVKSIKRQSPQKFNYDVTQEFYLARNPKLAQLDEGLQLATSHSDAYVRRGALERLIELAQQDPTSKISALAKDKINNMVNDVSPIVYEPAQRALRILQGALEKFDLRPSPVEIKCNDKTIWDVAEAEREHEISIVCVRIGTSCESEYKIDEDANLPLRKFLHAHFLQYEGYEYIWEHKVAVYLFLGSDRAERVVSSCRRLLEKSKSVTVDFLFKNMPPIFIAADDHKIFFSARPVGILASYSLDYLLAVSDDVHLPGNFGISTNLRRALNADLKLTFNNKYEQDGHFIYCGSSVKNYLRLPPELEECLRSLDGIWQRTEEFTDSSGEVAADWEELRFNINAYYEGLDHALHQIGEKLWSIDKDQICDGLEAVAVKEAEFRDKVSSWLSQDQALYDCSLMAPILGLMAIRGKEINVAIASVFTSLASEEAPGHVPNALLKIITNDAHSTEDDYAEEFLIAIDSLLYGDELDRDSGFTDLFLKYKNDLARYLSSAGSNNERAHLVDALWQRADRVLLEDLFPLKPGPNEKSIIAILALGDFPDMRFREVINILKSGVVPSIDEIHEKFSSWGACEPTDEETVLRCIFVGAPSPQVKRQVIHFISQKLLWHIVVHPRISPEIIIVALEKFCEASSKFPDLPKIFFDCIHLRLSQLASSKEVYIILGVGPILYRLFELEFFVEDLYFQRLTSLLDLHLSRCNSHGFAVDHFTEYMATLESRKEQLGNPAARLPKEVRRIPKAVQRRLAKDGFYIEYFVLHPDGRIALETFPHLDHKNIVLVLQYRSLNAQLLQKIVREPLFFRPRKNVEILLHHPKCPRDFATRHLASFSFRELAALASDGNANSSIRGSALVFALQSSACSADFARKNIGRISPSELVHLTRNAAANPEVRSIATSHLNRYYASRRS